MTFLAALTKYLVILLVVQQAIASLPWSKVKKKHIALHVINLDQDTERWNAVSAELGSKGVPRNKIKRIPGVYGNTLSYEEVRANSTTVARYFCTAGTIGCYLSHRNFWQDTLKSPFGFQIVLEDDVVVADDFMDRIQEVLQELEDCEETRNGNWDVVLLGALGCVHPEGKHGVNRIADFMAGGGRKRRLVTPHCHVPRRPMGMHAYLLSKKGAEKLVRQAWYASGHVDVIAWGTPNVDILCVHPMLANQSMANPSTIGAVTSGLETFIPKLQIDEYTGITLEWSFNAPVLRFGDFVLTMGRSIVEIGGGFLLAILCREQFPWMLPLQTAMFIVLFILTKLTTIPVGLSASPASRS
jgi:GR25 family glycosyltransferase involved in LPS biosynthesis